MLRKISKSLTLDNERWRKKRFSFPFMCDDIIIMISNQKYWMLLQGISALINPTSTTLNTLNSVFDKYEQQTANQIKLGSEEDVFCGIPLAFRISKWIVNDEYGVEVKE